MLAGGSCGPRHAALPLGAGRTGDAVLAIVPVLAIGSLGANKPLLAGGSCGPRHAALPLGAGRTGDAVLSWRTDGAWLAVLAVLAIDAVEAIDPVNAVEARFALGAWRAGRPCFPVLARSTTRTLLAVEAVAARGTVRPWGSILSCRANWTETPSHTRFALRPGNSWLSLRSSLRASLRSRGTHHAISSDSGDRRVASPPEADVNPTGIPVVPDPQAPLRFLIPGIAEFPLAGQTPSVLDDPQNSMNRRNGAVNHG